MTQRLYWFHLSTFRTPDHPAPNLLLLLQLLLLTLLHLIEPLLLLLLPLQLQLVEPLLLVFLIEPLLPLPLLPLNDPLLHW